MPHTQLNTSAKTRARETSSLDKDTQAGVETLLQINNNKKQKTSFGSHSPTELSPPAPSKVPKPIDILGPHQEIIPTFKQLANSFQSQQPQQKFSAQTSSSKSSSSSSSKTSSVDKGVTVATATAIGPPGVNLAYATPTHPSNMNFTASNAGFHMPSSPFGPPYYAPNPIPALVPQMSLPQFTQQNLLYPTNPMMPHLYNLTPPNSQSSDFDLQPSHVTDHTKPRSPTEDEREKIRRAEEEEEEAEALIEKEERKRRKQQQQEEAAATAERRKRKQQAADEEEEKQRRGAQERKRKVEGAEEHKRKGEEERKQREDTENRISAAQSFEALTTQVYAAKESKEAFIQGNDEVNNEDDNDLEGLKRSVDEILEGLQNAVNQSTKSIQTYIKQFQQQRKTRHKELQDKLETPYLKSQNQLYAVFEQCRALHIMPLFKTLQAQQ